MILWPLWFIIGCLVLGILANIGMIGKETTTKYTPTRAISFVVMNTLWIIYYVYLIKHVC